jgi:hypothetical protein
MRGTEGMNPKEKGNREERKQAKNISTWMFGDKDVLKRQSDSGALEIIWSGDVVPLKQMPLEWNSCWPFMMEIKTGYKKHYPDFWKYGMLAGWIKKAYKESKTHNQNILFIVTQFYKRTALVTTNYCTTALPFNVSFPVELDNEWKFMYVYRLKDMTDLDFREVFDFPKLVNTGVIHE